MRETAPRQQLRRQSQVVVRRQVEVIGNAQFESALVRGSERREQEPGLARVTDREGDQRRIENRHAFQFDTDITALPLLAALIDVDRGSMQEPVVGADRAGGEADLPQLYFTGRGQAEHCSGAARRTFRQLEFGAGELTAACRVPVAAFALQAQVGGAVLDIALDVEALSRCLVGCRVGTQPAIAPFDDDAIPSVASPDE
jgi:hypothetical protein